MKHIKSLIGFIVLSAVVYFFVGVLSYLTGYSFTHDAHWFYTLIVLYAMDTNFLFKGYFDEEN